MADKNRNGIPDDRENLKSLRAGGGNPFFNDKSWSDFQKGATYAPTEYNKPGFLGLGELGNYAIDSSRDFTNWWDSHVMGNRDRPQGGGLGDYRYGTAPQKTQMDLRKEDLLGPFRQAPQQLPMQDTPLPSFMDFLRQAQESGMFGENGGGFSPISYDPLRNDARSRASEYDAKLASMYQQLQGEMQGGVDRLDQSYADSQTGQAERGEAAQQAIQNASNAADNRNMQVAQNLGQGEAVARIIAEGRDLNTDTARAVQDAAARQQIGAEQLTQNRQNASEYGTRLVGAAGLEGADQRGRIQSELSALLAQYDMQEQQANQQAQMQAQQSRQQSLSGVMGLANALYQDSWKQREYQDDLSRWLFEQQAASAPQPDRFQLGVDRFGAIQGQPWAEDMDPDQLAKLMQVITSAGKL